MRGIERHQRRETITPFGNVVQRAGVGGFIGIVHLHARADRPGIGKRHADIETEQRSRIIEGKNLQRIVLLGDDNAGRIA